MVCKTAGGKAVATEELKGINNTVKYYLQVQKGLGKKHEFWDDYVHSGCRVIKTQDESPFDVAPDQ